MSVSDERGDCRVTAENLALRRSGRVLFSGIAFDVAAGGVLLLVGPNGAGKSSLLLTIAGALRPEAGRVVIVGGDLDSRPETALHFVGHASGIKGQLSAAENLRFWADLYGGDRDTIAPSLKAVGLGELEDLPAGYLSAGQTRRLALARLLVARRPIWLLDEPTAALDLGGQGLVADLIDGHAATGGLVIAATHDPLRLTTAPATLHLGGPA